MPSALADLGGWTNPDVHNWFGDYAEIIDARIGDRMEGIATINEPWCTAYLSHFLGVHAPGLRDIRAASRAMHHVLKAHGEAMTRLRAKGRKNLGIALNFEYANPATNDPKDIAAAATEDAIYNRWFIEAITKGTYPAEALEGFEPHMPKGWQDDLKTHIHQPLDWLGVNYYTRKNYAHDPEATAWPTSKPVQGHRETTQMGWEVYPEGLHHFLTRMKNDYVGDLPMYVTENGFAWEDHIIDGKANDPERIKFIQSHLGAMKKAVDEGVNLNGFFYWSLLDNYEWAEGYAKRFGIVHVDFDTLDRTPKASYEMLKQALKRD
jgi:beta-glucosidase